MREKDLVHPVAPGGPRIGQIHGHANELTKARWAIDVEDGVVERLVGCSFRKGEHQGHQPVDMVAMQVRDEDFADVTQFERGFPIMTDF